jgi:ribosomal-protein-alanine acetyltransferase
MHIRSGEPSDLPSIRAIQDLSPTAAQWAPGDYNFLVAEADGAVVGFLVWHVTAPDEAEVLNLAVMPALRRRGIALELLRGLSSKLVFLEVRESNQAARSLYRAAGFQECGVRPRYYDNPSESAIVMRLQS